MLNRDGWAGVVLAVFGTIVAIMAITQESLTAQYGPGPGFMPLVLSLMIVLLSLVLIMQSRKKAAASGSAKREDPMFHRPALVFGCVGSLILAALFLEKLGFIIIIWALTAFYTKIIKSDFALYKCILVGLITSVVFYVLFSYALNLNLPKGVIPL